MQDPMGHLTFWNNRRTTGGDRTFVKGHLCRGRRHRRLRALIITAPSAAQRGLRSVQPHRAKTFHQTAPAPSALPARQYHSGWNGADSVVRSLAGGSGEERALGPRVMVRAPGQASKNGSCKEVVDEWPSMRTNASLLGECCWRVRTTCVIRTLCVVCWETCEARLAIRRSVCELSRKQLMGSAGDVSLLTPGSGRWHSSKAHKDQVSCQLLVLLLSWAALSHCKRALGFDTICSLRVWEAVPQQPEAGLGRYPSCKKQAHWVQ
jgi:hypothetical protein